MFEQIDSQMQLLPTWVQVWMNWILLVFAASLLFVRRHQAARWALLAFVMTMPAVALIFYLQPNVHLFGAAHLLLWSPLLAYIWRRELRSSTFSPRTAYGVWLGLLVATIVISLLFDVRDLVLVMMGKK